MQYAASRITIQAVHDAFLRRAEDAGTEAVAIARGMEGLPRLLPRAAFAALCNRLAVQLDRSGAEMAPEDMPVLLQAYFKPSLDLRFVTSFTNDGASVTCHTFQRRYSTRYLPFWGSSSPGALAMPSAGGITDCSPETPGVAAAVSEAGIVMVAGGALGSIASAACAPALSQVQHRQKQHHPMAELSERERVDLGRSPGPALGPVDPALKMALRKAAQGLVQYVQRAHLLTLRSLVCEFARDCSGTIHFLAPLRADWASIIPGHGGEPWAAANLTAPAVEEESWCAVESRGIECAEVSTVEAVDMQQQQQGNMAAELPSAGHTPSSCGDAEAQTELQQEPGSPLIAAVPAEGADPESQQQQQQQSPLKAALAMESPLTTAPAAASVAAFRRSPGVLRNTLAPVPKSPAQLASHLTRELVAAQVGKEGSSTERNISAAFATYLCHCWGLP